MYLLFLIHFRVHQDVIYEHNDRCVRYSLNTQFIDPMYTTGTLVSPYDIRLIMVVHRSECYLPHISLSNLNLVVA